MSTDAQMRPHCGQRSARDGSAGISVVTTPLTDIDNTSSAMLPGGKIQISNWWSRADSSSTWKVKEDR